MIFGSVCSGIEAASVAWEPLGWKACWFAEVDDAANAVLAYRYPNVPNHGDMTLLAELVRARKIVAPDVLVGGTPCQAFSVAGLRQGLADERGQLTLAFVDLANAIDEVRRADCQQPCIIVWENVPGVLSSKDNAFGCFLAGVAGEGDALVPAGCKWTHAGCVLGPERAVSWRIQDAQYHGLAQRRRRVFVVASAREGFDPAAVLLEFDGVRRDTPPRRKAGEGAARTAVTGADDRSGSGPVRGSAWVVGYGGNRTSGSLNVSTAMNAHRSRHDFESETFVVHGTQDPCFVVDGPAFAIGRNSGGENAVAFTSKDYGGDATEELSPTIRASGHTGSHANGGAPPAVAYGFQPRIARNGRGDMGDLVNALSAQSGETGKGDAAPCVAVLPFGTTQVTSPTNGSNPQWGDPCHGLARGNHPPAVCVTGDVTHTLKAEGFDASEDGTVRGQPITPVAMAVRRLMPIECERLQGFPDNHTRIPVKHYGTRRITKTRPPEMWEEDPKGGWWLMAADGPRYKQLGNSMATNVMAWIGCRIAAAIDEQHSLIGHNGGSACEFEELLG